MKITRIYCFLLIGFIFSSCNNQNVAAPILNIGITNNNETYISLSSKTVGVIYYFTLDGSVPNSSSFSTSDKIIITDYTNIKAIAVKEGLNDSAISEGVFDKLVVTPETEIRYTEAFSEISIIGCAENTTEIVIPAVIDGKPVTSIADNAFENSQIISIIFPDSVITMGNNVFRNCFSLISVSISPYVKTIGDFSFNGCTSLVTISIPENVTTIGRYAFADCISLSSISISDSVTSIRDYPFISCKSLTSIIIPAGVTALKSPFLGCSSLKTITILNKDPFTLEEVKDVFGTVAPNYEIRVPANSVGFYKTSREWIEYADHIIAISE